MIHIARDGQKLGTWPLEEINARLASGDLLATDLSWWEGAVRWVPVIEAPGVVVPGNAGAAPAADPFRQPVSAPVAAPQSSSSVYAPPRSSLSPSAAPGAVSPAAVLALAQTRPWVLFLAVLAAVGAGLMLLAALGMLFMGGSIGAGIARAGGTGAAMPAAMMGVMAFIYLIFAVLYIYPIVKLFKFAGAIARLKRTTATADLEEALRQQKSFWKFAGIVTLIFVIIYTISILAVVGFGAFAANSPRKSTPLPVLFLDNR